VQNTLSLVDRRSSNHEWEKEMWIALLAVLVLLVWGLLAVAACVVSGRATRMEENDHDEMDAYVDATASELLADINLESLDPR
jgi:flagellar basal body-associated protein FliL